VRNSLPNDSPF